MTTVRLENLTASFPGAPRPAVDRLTLECPSGTLTALLGPSGCGKSTTLRMIAGLVRPSAGDVLFDDRSVLAEPPERRGAAMVFQNHLLFPAMSVADNVGFGLRMRGVPKAEIAARAAAMLERVRLAGFGSRRPRDLSGGQQQRVALARALVTEPHILLLDEPFSSLDPDLRDEMRDLVRDLQRASGVTMLFVTHDREEAVGLADRLALMLDGRLRQVGPAEEVYRRPADVETARFFGGRTFVAGEVRGGRFEGPLGPLRVAGGPAEGRGVLTIRPESVRLAAPEERENRVAACVIERRFAGSHTRLRLEAGGETLEMTAAPDVVARLRDGDEVDVVLPPEALWVIAG